MTRQLLGRIGVLRAVDWFVLGGSSAARSALWVEAMHVASNGTRINENWAAQLPLAPPRALRAQALQWLSEIALHDIETSRHAALRGIAIDAAHPDWSLSTEERARLQTTVLRIAEASPQCWALWRDDMRSASGGDRETDREM